MFMMTLGMISGVEYTYWEPYVLTTCLFIFRKYSSMYIRLQVCSKHLRASTKRKTRIWTQSKELKWTADSCLVYDIS